jgi:hypothetical protein
MVRRIHGADLNRVLGSLENLIPDAARISIDPSGDVSIGVSRLGGTPDYPGGVRWPEWSRTPLAFLSLVRMADASQPPRGSLPDTGLIRVAKGVEAAQAESEAAGGP